MKKPVSLCQLLCAAHGGKTPAGRIAQSHFVYELGGNDDDGGGKSLIRVRCFFFFFFFSENIFSRVIGFSSSFSRGYKKTKRKKMKFLLLSSRFFCRRQPSRLDCPFDGWFVKSQHRQVTLLFSYISFPTPLLVVIFGRRRVTVDFHPTPTSSSSSL